MSLLPLEDLSDTAGSDSQSDALLSRHRLASSKSELLTASVEDGSSGLGINGVLDSRAKLTWWRRTMKFRETARRPPASIYSLPLETIEHVIEFVGFDDTGLLGTAPENLLSTALVCSQWLVPPLRTVLMRPVG